MKTVIAIAAIFFLLNPVVKGKKDMSPTATVYKWVIEPQSTLTINGKSNVNTFKCGITAFLHTDTLVYINSEAAQKPAVLKGTVTIEIKQFDCGHRFMTNDLRRTLKADENPVLKIRFLTMEKLLPRTASQKVKGLVEIELAGIVKQYEINYDLLNNNPARLQLNGSRDILFSDFRLKPPTRLAGLVKVAQEITVQFQLLLKPI
jgi:hypothetical protein